MQTEAITEITIKKKPLKYAEAIKILMDGGTGAKARVIEESGYAAKCAIVNIRHNLANRGIRVRTHYWGNIAEIERI